MTATAMTLSAMPFTVSAEEKEFLDYTFEELMEMSDEEIMNIKGEFSVIKGGEETTETIGSLYSEYLERSKFVIDSELDPDNPRATNEEIFFSFTKEIVDKYDEYFTGVYDNFVIDDYTEKVLYIDPSIENITKAVELLHIPKDVINEYRKGALSMSFSYMNANSIAKNTNTFWMNPMVYGKENAYKTRALCFMFTDPKINHNIENFYVELKGSDCNNTSNMSDYKGDANCDGNVNMADAVLIMQSLANPNKYGINGTHETHITAQGEFNGDMDGNGLTNADALAIQRKMLNLD